MSENLYFYKGLESNLPKSNIKTGALYHCTDTGNTYIGTSSTAMKLYSTKVGKATNTNGGEIFNDLTNNVASAQYAHAEGYKTQALKTAAHAEGSNTIANGAYSHAEGSNTIAYGAYAHAEGTETYAEGVNMSAHAEGRMTSAIGTGSHAEGFGSSIKTLKIQFELSDYTLTTDNKPKTNTILINGNQEMSGSYRYFCYDNSAIWIKTIESVDGGIKITLATTKTFSVGDEDKTLVGHLVMNGALGWYTHSEGQGTTAASQGSHAEGIGTIASLTAQHVQGQYNEIDANGSAGNYAHIIGWGTSNKRKNIHTIDTSGNAMFTGGVTTNNLLIKNGVIDGGSDSKGNIYIGNPNNPLDVITNLRVDNGDIYVRDKKVVTNQSDNDSTVIIGSGTSIGNNTIVIGQNSSAVSDDAIAIGHNVTAGCRGFYWTSISGTTLQLSTSQNKNAWEKKDGLDPSEQLDHWDEGDVISFNNDTRYVLKSTITNIDYTNHRITFDELPFEEKVFIADPSYEDYAIVNPRKPNRGVISFAPGSFVAGLNNSATGRASVALSENNIAAGNWSFAEGYENIAIGTCSHAEGYSTVAGNGYAHAEGYETIASGARSHAEGYKTLALGSNSHAEGSNNYAIGVGSHVEGNPFSQTVKLTGSANADTYTYSSGQHQIDDYFVVGDIYSTITDVNTSTKQITVSRPLTNVAISNKEFTKYRPNCSYGVGSHAEGRGTYAEGNGAHAEGQNTMALAHGSHAEGASTTASGAYAHAEGGATTASGTRAHAEGHETLADGFNAHAEGNYVKASGISAHAEGGYYKGYDGKTDDSDVTLDGTTINGTVAEGDFAHAEGRQTYAKGIASHTEGYRTLANGDKSHAEGHNTKATGIASHAEGANNITVEGTSFNKSNAGALGVGSHSEGLATCASARGAHAEGSNTTASGNSSHAEGNNTTASGAYSHAEGDNSTKAVGTASHAEGSKTEANANYSHAEGSTAKANGLASHAEGSGSVAYGDYSHAEGGSTDTYGNYSHSEGWDTLTRATGIAAHAEGKNTIAYGEYQHVQGAWNIEDKGENNKTPSKEGQYAHIVGNGIDKNNRSNAHTLDWDGNAWFAGGITADTGLNISKNSSTYRFIVNGSNGNTSVGGTLTVAGATTLSSTLTVNGNTTLKGNISLGDSTTNDTLTIKTKSASFGGTLSVTGATTLSSTLTVAGKTTLNGGLVLDADTYGTDNLSTKTGTTGQIYFKKV